MGLGTSLASPEAEVLGVGAAMSIGMLLRLSLVPCAASPLPRVEVLEAPQAPLQAEEPSRPAGRQFSTGLRLLSDLEITRLQRVMDEISSGLTSHPRCCLYVSAAVSPPSDSAQEAERTNRFASVVGFSPGAGITQAVQLAASVNRLPGTVSP